MSAHEKVISDIKMWDARLASAGYRMGLAPYPTHYHLVSDQQMVRLIPYVMLPTHYRHWSFGKKYEQQVKAGGSFHIFEAVINSNPSFCYLGLTNQMAMQVLVMAHAKWGHVDFFANNFLFKESGASSIVERLAQNAEFVKRLTRNPMYGVEKVEYILDAAHALDDHVGWLPTFTDKVSEKQARQELEHRLIELEMQLKRTVSDFEAKGIKEDIEAVRAKLKVDPINPTGDILSFIMDEKNNPRLGEEERGLIAIARDQARYLQPQARTKIMNEGWASYWEKHLLKQPETGIEGTNWMLELPTYWSMHDRQATDFYFNPYTVGLSIFDYIDRKYGFDEGETEVDAPVFTTREETDEDRTSADAALKTLDGKVVEWTGETKKVKVTVRNREKMFSVRKNHEDKTFIREFLTDELIEHINEKALDWVQRVIGIINRAILKHGWGPQHVVHPIPQDLEGLMGVVEKWMNLAEASEQMRQEGWPMFPAPSQTLKTMGTVLQLVAAYDEDKKRFRNMMVVRTGYHSVPRIEVVDGGAMSNDVTGTLTLRHVHDETFGFLLQSECKDTVRYARRLWGRPVRLITKEQQEDRWGRPVGEPRDYEYLCDEDGEVRERWL